MPELYKNKTECCGCSACYDVCPKQAITMTEDSEGFLYPAIDETKCIKCGLCEKVCPVKNEQENKSLLKSYAAYNKDEEIRLKSSSGGIFTLLAEQILQSKGVIYGAAFDKNFEVEHIRIEKAEELEKLRGSKYVQSCCNGIFNQCKQDLNAGRQVLFTGTPCQISALKSYLNKTYDNLVCMDIICHGVPSRKVWRKYLEYRVNFAKSKIAQIAFRLKNEGWKQYAVKFTFANSTAYCENLHNDIFMRGFLKDLYLRPSCHNCKFKTKERISDITVADFWGIDKLHPEWDDDKGMSLVIVHTEKGGKLLGNIKTQLFIKEVEFDKAILANSAMVKSAIQNPLRGKFFKEIDECKDIDKLIRDHTKPTNKERIKYIVKIVLKKLGLLELIKSIVCK